MYAMFNCDQELPPFVTSISDTLSAVKMKIANSKTHPWRPTEKSAAGALTISTLYCKAANVTKESFTAHSVMADIEMNIVVATHPLLWGALLTKGRKPCSIKHLVDRDMMD